MGLKTRQLVIINQAANYLTVDLCNAFAKKISNLTLITGNVHSQGKELDFKVNVRKINKYIEKPAFKKFLSHGRAFWGIFWLLKIRYRNHEVFFISQPPMGYLVNLLVGNKFTTLVWDVYPDILKVTGMQAGHPIYRAWSWLNYYSFKKAHTVFTIGEKMAVLLSQYVNPQKIVIKKIWSAFQGAERIPKEENPFIPLHNLKNKFVVQYSGNIGVTHKVEIILELAEMLSKETDIVFQIIGRGSRVESLQSIVLDKGLCSCQILPFQNDDLFLSSLSAADLGVVILDERVSSGSVPSKSYNLMSLGIPSLYISSKDSEMENYAVKYKHARNFPEQEISQIGNFILEIARNKALWQEMSDYALCASIDFRRNNADLIVEEYLSR